jgi:hypothetical protein
MGDEVREARIDVDGVEISGDFGIRFVYTGCGENIGIDGHSVTIIPEKNESTISSTVTLNINDRSLFQQRILPPFLERQILEGTESDHRV